MHDTAYEIGSMFFGVYAPPKAAILDVGAMDLNGSLRTAAPVDGNYLGVDLAAGRGVDLVLDDPYALPFKDGVFDVVVSSSCLEHDAMFWLSFLELIRVIKPGGYLYANVPSNGWYHTHPIDAWRCYPDAGVALETWFQRQGHDVTLVESFVAPRKEVIWNDFVMIFGKGALKPVAGRVANQVAGAMNVRVAEEPGVVKNRQVDAEDLQIIKKLSQEIEDLKRRNVEMARALESHRQAASNILANQ